MAQTLHFHCPGRVNLIGEHIDYNGGLVMPFCISKGIDLQFTPLSIDHVILISEGFDQVVATKSEILNASSTGNWFDFPIGVMKLLAESGIEIPFGNYEFKSDLPTGSGLSSSAAIEVLTYYAVHLISTGEEPDRVRMALDCQKVENDFVGVKCGIMDQFAVANGKLDRVIQLDCSTLEYQQVPIRSEGFSWLIIDSKRPRTLAGSAYNERKVQCEEALRILQSNHEIEGLCSADANWESELIAPILKKRFRHCVSEQERVNACASALKDGDMITVGNLLSESHRSLKDDYEVSCDELDLICSNLNGQESVLGARMTGAGFGGCCVALVETEGSNKVISSLKEAYHERFNIELECFITTPNDGVRQMRAL